jgi:DNA-binding MarR family transcriptional regulator
MRASDDRYEITWLIRRLFRVMADLADRELEDRGISAADRAVMEFLYPDEQLTVPDIAARYRVSRQHVQVTANRLRDTGYLETVANPRHKRSPLLRLTEPGIAMFGDIRTREQQLLEAAFADVSRDECRVTRATLARLLAHFEEAVDEHFKANT